MKHSCNQYLGVFCKRTQDSLADFLVAEETVAAQKPIPSGAAVGGLCEGPALRYVSAGAIEIVFRNDLPPLLRVFILDGLETVSKLVSLCLGKQDRVSLL
jgi:hypothetical protein